MDYTNNDEPSFFHNNSKILSDIEDEGQKKSTSLFRVEESLEDPFRDQEAKNRSQKNPTPLKDPQPNLSQTPTSTSKPSGQSSPSANSWKQPKDSRGGIGMKEQLQTDRFARDSAQQDITSQSKLTPVDNGQIRAAMNETPSEEKFRTVDILDWDNPNRNDYYRDKGQRGERGPDRLEEREDFQRRERPEEWRRDRDDEWRGQRDNDYRGGQFRRGDDRRYNQRQYDDDNFHHQSKYSSSSRGYYNEDRRNVQREKGDYYNRREREIQDRGYREQERPDDRNWKRDGYDYNRKGQSSHGEKLLDQPEFGKSEMKSVFKDFSKYPKGPFSYMDENFKKDSGANQISEKNMQDLEEKFNDRMKEFEYQENYKEDNLLDEHKSYSSFTQKKKRNLVDNFCVFKDLNQDFPYKYKFQRKNNLRQFTEELPIYAKKKEFMDAYNSVQVIIFKSNAGSGKSTQLPQYMLDCAKGRTLVTEPRVIAVENLARRVRQEISDMLDDRRNDKIIGYIAGPKYDFDPQKTAVLYMTEQEFKKQIINDKLDFLNCFEAFIVDEAHELKKNSMLILAALKNFAKKSGKHKIIVTSATLSTKLFEDYFNDMSFMIIEAVTPTFQVEVHHTIFPDLEMSLIENTACHLKEIFGHIKRNFVKSAIMPNILVFMPSVKEIKEIIDHIRTVDSMAFDKINDELHFCLEELHGALKPQEKMDVIKPNKELKGTIRIIFASKIAETAITIEDIYYVLDSGLEREYYYDEITKMNFIKETKISKSSADQRKGRAGRIANGYCFKMYKEEEEVKFRDNKIPEILRMDISDIILCQIELSDLFKFKDLMFFSELDLDRINSITAELERLNAIETRNKDKSLTKKGNFMMRMSCGTLVSAFLYECHRLEVLTYGTIAASALENAKSFFKDSQTLKDFSMSLSPNEIKEQETLGDLAPLLAMSMKYKNFSATNKREFHSRYQITEREMNNLFRKHEEIQNEINSLSHFLEQPVKKNINNELKLQEAFLKTFPKNICLAADETLEYPFYMMIKDKLLMRVHGSSVVTLLHKKPQWVCCQNIILSTITGRPMARVLVPIKETVLQELAKVDYKKALKMHEDRLPQRIVERDVPTSILRFFRSKNHNEFIQKELRENKAYLETDEERESILYFYVRELDKDDLKKKQIVEMKMRIMKYAEEMVKKQHFLFSISDRTKMQVNQLGQVVDVLTSQEFLSFVLKSTSVDFYSRIQEIAERLKISTDCYYIKEVKERGITTVSVNNKHLAAKLYSDVNKMCKKTGIGCFPLCGFNSDYAAKFKKWKVDILWYEKPKSPNARVFFENLEVANSIVPEMRKRFNFSKQMLDPGVTAPFVEILGIIGRDFEDEIDLEDYIRTLVNHDKRFSFNVSVERGNPSRFDGFGGYREDLQEDLGVFDKETREEVKEAVECFIAGANHSEKVEVKELAFIEEIGMSRDVASQLDIEARKKLENIFPELGKFNILCFKRKRNTCRRALVFPQEYKYKNFMDSMVKFLTKYNGKKIEELDSRIRVTFKGKYIIRIDDDTFRNFEHKIKETISKTGLQLKVKMLLRRREIEIQGSHEKVLDMRNCVKEIMGFLFPKVHALRPDLQKYDLFSLKSKQGQDQLSKLNNKFSGKAFGRFDSRLNNLTIRGDAQNRPQFIKLLESWIEKFNNKVKKEYFKLQNPRLYFKNKLRAKEYALNIDSMLKFVSDNKGNKGLEILCHEYIPEDDRCLQPSEMEKRRKENIITLKQKLTNLFNQSDSSPALDNSIGSDNRSVSYDQKNKCLICDQYIERRYRLFCKHGFCEVCIKQYILDQYSTSEEGICLCPHTDCGKQVFLMDMVALLSQEELKDMFMNQKEPFLKGNSMKYKQCPTPDCDNILSSPDNNSLVQGDEYLNINPTGVVFCDSCGNDFCFKCLKNHYDSDCVGNPTKESSGSKPSMSSSLSSSQPQSMRKACPGCRNMAERQRGQDHIICTVCKTNFCFLCLEDFGRAAETDEVNHHFQMKHNGMIIREGPNTNFEGNIFK